jgi:hypothetical protein
VNAKEGPGLLARQAWLFRLNLFSVQRNLSFMTNQDFENALDWIHEEKKKIARAIQKTDDKERRAYFKSECLKLNKPEKELWNEQRGYVPWAD